MRARARKSICRAGVWFVDIPRTSSTSVKAELGRLFGGEYRKSVEREAGVKRKKYFHDHTTAGRMKHALRESVWQELFTFSVVRNPWDRFLSLYRFRIALGDLPAEIPFTQYAAMLKDVTYRRNHSPFAEWHYHMSMCDFLMDELDQVLVNRVYRMEDREEMIVDLNNRFGLELREVHKEKLSDGRSYREFYDDETAEMVGEYFRDDIANFSYEF